MLDLTARLTARRTSALLVAGLLLLPALPGQDVSRASVLSPAAAVADIDPTLVGLVAVGPTDVVVRTVPGATEAVAAEVTSLGGRVLAELPFIDAFAANLDANVLAALAARDDVVAVTADHEAEFFGNGNGNGKAKGKDNKNAQGQPLGDHWFDETINADAVHGLGVDGTGVGIAILDSGITSHPTIDGRLGAGIDLSGEDNGLDGHGHGTYLSGLAAGNGSSSPGDEWGGVAPGAHLIPVKVGGQNGVSLIALLQGLQWIQFNKNTHDIDVVNMSFGTRSPQSYTIDPLNFAVQRLWASGIVVVVAAGNLGTDGASTITKPGDDPFVITVGSTDSQGTKTRNDDTVPDFSGRGPTLADGIAKPDIVAPGRSLIGPVATGSAVDAMEDAKIADRWVRASGTSMSTAVVSGAIALMLQANPTWTPDQVKGALIDTAAPGPVGDPNVDGHGLVDVAAAIMVTNPSNPNQGIPFGTGTGSLEATLGDMAAVVGQSAAALPQIVTITIAVETCILGICATVNVDTDVSASSLEFYDGMRYIADFEATSWEATQWSGNQWWGNQWFGNQWFGNQWFGNQWFGNQWWGNQWFGNQWFGNQWWGNQWFGNQWWGNQWFNQQWYGNQWWGNQWWGSDWA